MAIFTIHHWTERDLGLRELARVSRRTDGFTGAYWNRPERYLEPAVQAGMSTLARLDPDARARWTERLRRAIESGDWERRYGSLRNQAQYDMGYRLVLSRAYGPR